MANKEEHSVDNFDDFRDYFFDQIIGPVLDEELQRAQLSETGEGEMQKLQSIVGRFQNAIMILMTADVWPEVSVPLDLSAPISPAEALGLTDTHLEKAYDYVQDIFDQGLYEEASDICLFLTRLAPNERAFWVALGMCEQLKGDHKASALAYSTALELGNQDFYPALYAAICLVHHNKRDLAYKLLNEVLDEVEGEDAEFDLIAEEMLDQLA